MMREGPRRIRRALLRRDRFSLDLVPRGQMKWYSSGIECGSPSTREKASGCERIRNAALAFRRRGTFSRPYWLDRRSDAPEQYLAVGWVGDGMHSVIFKVREDDEGEILHLVTLWRSTKEEVRLSEENSQTRESCGRRRNRQVGRPRQGCFSFLSGRGPDGAADSARERRRHGRHAGRTRQGRSGPEREPSGGHRDAARQAPDRHYMAQSARRPQVAR